MSYVDGKYIPDPFKPRHETKDRMSKGKLVAVREKRVFLEKLDDFMAAVSGEMKGNMRTVHNRSLACK
jgi:hypothetical protein